MPIHRPRACRRAPARGPQAAKLARNIRQGPLPWSWGGPRAFRRPGNAAAHGGDSIIKIARSVNAFRRYADHALRASTALRRRFAHPRLEKALRLEPIDRRINRADRALLPGMPLNRFADRRTVGVVAEPSRSGNQQIFKLTQHNKHIVRLMLVSVKPSQIG